MRKDDFVDLHVHTEGSQWDGYTTPKELVAETVNHGRDAVAITDHGNVSLHPYFQKEADKVGVKPIFGIEAYFCDDRLIRPEGDKELAKRLQKEYFHLTLLARTQEGLTNLWAASTESWADGAYPAHRPRMDWETLGRHGEGLVALTGCLSGPVATAIKEDDEDLARERLSRLLKIFGDNLYLEIMPNAHIPEQVVVNKALVGLGQEFGVPLVATVDSHYPTKDHQHIHAAWMQCQTTGSGKSFDADNWTWIQSTEEIRKGLDHLPQNAIDESIASTREIADKCDARINPKPVKLHYSKSRDIRDDDKALFEMCMDGWGRTLGTGIPQEAYMARFEREFALFKRKGFTPYFLMVADYCKWAHANNILVGPGRGSAAASLVAYLIGITGLDPLKDELLFERFMTDGRQDYPDIDVDFPASKREDIQNYIRSKYGDDYVVRVGTHLRYKNKAAFAALFRIGKEDFANPEEAFQDSRAIAKIIDEAEADQAGLGLKWDELMEKAEDEFRPFKAKYPEIFRMAEDMVNRLNSYGRHAAGMAISTEEKITGTIPLRAGENGQSMITQFEMKDLEMLGLVKFDILTISTLDKIQIAFDMLRERGVHVDPYKWGEKEMSDPKVWDFLNEGKTLGVFQVETHSGTKMTARMQPKSIQDLSALVALVRPGPMNSGLTDMYLRRRDGKEKLEYPHPKMEKFTHDTQGALVYQEQVMQTCIDLAGFTPVEADKVRKVLGKKLKDEIAQWGEKFVTQAKDRGIDPSITKPLWDQITEFAKYGFNKAHSAAYAMLGFWTLYTKYKYGPEFFAAAMSTAEKDRIPEFVREARRMGIKVLPQDINISGREFQVNGNEVRYGLGSIKGIGAGAVNKMLAARSEGKFESFLDFQARSGANSAVTLLLARVGAFDNLPDVGNRKALVMRLEAEKDGSAKTCIFKDMMAKGPNELPCTFDWDSEPQPEPEINPKTGKKRRAKVLTIPKRCTVRCRNYTPPEPIDPSTIVDYTDREKRDIEMELLGIHLSSTVFDELDPEVREKFRDQAEGLANGPNKVYTVAGTISSLSVRQDKNGKPYGRWKMETEVSDVDVVAFGPTWSSMKDMIKTNAFVVVELDKRDRDPIAKSATRVY